MGKQKNKKDHRGHRDHGAPQAPPPPPPEKVVKKKSGCLSVIILILLLLLALLLLFFHFGLFGLGNGSNTKNSDGTSDKSGQTTTSQNEEKLEVTVMGHEYVYDNDKIELEDLITAIKNTNANVTVYIKDSNAIDREMTDLKDRLTSEGIAFVETPEEQTTDSTEEETTGSSEN